MLHPQRQFPPPNDVLEKRRISQGLSNHKKKLQNARAVIDTRSPPLYLHLHVKLKKLQIEGDRRKEIHCENMRLLDRMNHIMERNPAYDKNLLKKERGSLNNQKSREDQFKIMQENNRLLQKLLKVETEYQKPRVCKMANSKGKCSRATVKERIGSSAKLSTLERSDAHGNKAQNISNSAAKNNVWGSRRTSEFSTSAENNLRKMAMNSNQSNIPQEKNANSEAGVVNKERPTRKQSKK